MTERRRQGPRHVPEEQRAASVAALTALRTQGALTGDRVAAVAEALGVGRRTVWRWVSGAGRVTEPSSGSRRFEVDDDDVAELAYWHGSIAALHRARGGAPSERTLRRAFARALRPGQLAGLAGGEAVRRSFDTYLQRPARHRNECWEADHCELAIEVLLPDGQVIKPWLTSFIDRYSRAVCGWAISGYPSQESVLGALRAAILTEAPFGPVGGVPAAIRWDRGKEFLAGAVGTAARALGIDARALPPYSPHLKGVIERFHESIEVLLLDELPGFTHAPERQRRPRVAAKPALLSLDVFVALFAAFVTKYQSERPHAGLDGENPLERWQGNPVPLVEIARGQLNHLLLARETRVVGKKGIRLFGADYNTADLVGLVGETVEVRYMPHHHESVEVFLGGRQVGTAMRADVMDDEEAGRLRRRRVEEERWLARQERAATRRRNRRFAVITEAPPAEEADPPHAPRTLTPSRSLVDHGEIPAHWVRPLETPES